MYYPYLRGKQYELLALREMSEELSIEQREKVRPIIEPVKRSNNDTQTLAALTAMMKKGVVFAYVLNPQNGDFEKGNEIYYPDEVKKILEEGGKWLPAFLLSGDAKWLGFEISRLIAENDFKEILVVLPKNEDISKWDGILSRPEVKTIVCCDAGSHSTRRQISRYGKDIVRLDDCFQMEQRNKDFRGKEDQRFNDNAAFYAEDGFVGFGDYTILPGTYVKSGMLPWVVAIHMTYNKNEEEVWIHHFLSVTNDNGTENIQGKFHEAANKVASFFEDYYPMDMTPAVGKMHKFVADGHYPGLGTLKKLSIEHHITLMSRK